MSLLLGMGADRATPGKQTALFSQYVDEHKAEMSPVVGKSTLVERYLETAPTDFKAYYEQAMQRELAPVIAQAGKRFRDGGGFEFECTREGNFRISAVPGGPQGKYGPRIGVEYTLAKDPGIWHAVRTEMSKKLHSSEPAAAPKPATSPRTANAPMPVPVPDPAHAHLDTLSIALAKIEKDGAKSFYKRPNADEAKAYEAQTNQMVGGKDEATMFWCSGFSMWTLSKAGYSMEDTLKDKNGVEFWWDEVKTAKTAAAAERLRTSLTAEERAQLAPNEYLKRRTISLRAAVDGWTETLRPLREFLNKRPEKACSLGIYRTVGSYDEAYAAGGDDIGARGAASAFESFGIGVSVEESEQKPGDFAQSWKKKNGSYTQGHAFQVASVTAFGTATFGFTGSPTLLPGEKPKGAKKKDAVPESVEQPVGEREGVHFRIDHTTNPMYVGTHVVKKAQRAEATLADAMVAYAGQDPDKNGGIRVSKDYDVPVTPGSAEERIYFGRLASSPWFGRR